MRIRLVALSIILTAIFTGCDGQTNREIEMDYKDDKLESGQIWKYKTREGEEDSRVTILKVEKYEKGGIVVHVAVTDININNPQMENEKSNEISHLPFSKESILKSLTDLDSSDNNLPDFEEGYNEWKQAFDSGKGGIFTIEVKEAVEYVEQIMNQ